MHRKGDASLGQAPVAIRKPKTSCGYGVVSNKWGEGRGGRSPKSGGRVMRIIIFGPPIYETYHMLGLLSKDQSSKEHGPTNHCRT